MKRLLFTTLSVALVACSQSGGTSTGNPLVDLKINAYNSTLVSQKTDISTSLEADINTMAVSSLKFCFKRLRFKHSEDVTSTDPSTDSDNLDFYLGEVTISSLGTNLNGVVLPAGVYSRVEFDLEDSCPSGKSIEVTNSNGSFSTNDRITIKFEGTFIHNAAGETLGLNIQQIVSALNTVTNNSNIRSKAESASGSF